MISQPNCSKRKCKSYIGIRQDKFNELTERPVCKAFPDRIPDRIAYGNDLHLVVADDQSNSIIFEPIKPEK